MFDRFLITCLVLGVWALVLKPSVPYAQVGQECDVEGTGYGEIDGDEVYVYRIDAVAYCN